MSAQMGLALPEQLAPDTLRVESATKLEQVVVEFLGEPLAGVVERAFSNIELAEAEIADFKGRFPDQANELHGTFRFLCWYLDIPAPEPVYRHHARELLQRVVDGKSLRCGTEAEALMCLHVTSLKAPLTTEATNVAIDLFSSVYGEVTSIMEHKTPEQWPGASEEVLGTITSKLARNRDCRNQ